MFKFSKPKTPGYGISQQYYLTVLAAKASLPAIEDVVHPRAHNGAVEGFGVPLSADAGPDDLQRPMERGAYAVATRDRKTVLKCLVLSKEEAGFDPETFANSVVAMFAQPELVARIRATWSLIQLSFETYDPAVAPSADFLLRIAAKVAELTDGVIADPIAQRYFMPDEISGNSPETIDAVVHIAVRQQPTGPNVRVATLGMQKFLLPEYSIADVPERLATVGEAFLLSLAQSHFRGKIPTLGDRVGAKGAPFLVCESVYDPRMDDGSQQWELVPGRKATAEESLLAWAAETKV